ncbi:DAK2 domain-containing protein [Devosia sp. 2618]|uniref:DAK2 domain-containing protein n=1 Tax=Devosia sp. 2618 TaxID=3156454 RepID=UPI00339911EB
MSITVESISRVMADAAISIKQHEQALNAADSRLGDGDTGGMLARVIGKMAEQDLSTAADPGAALGQLARAAASATGSSLGTLLATALLTISRETKGRPEIDQSALSDLVGKARDAMMIRGGANLGDKTVLDAVDAAARALSGAANPREAVAQAAQAALEQFRDKPNRIGRARMFGDATIGVDDPGMLAFALLARDLSTTDQLD